ncbi:MAG: GFA family protein [Gammaproteobacteria bacterium]|nr:GFA family protein [Gammaproteobacteria bacterium]
MEPTPKTTGGCLCGAVRYRVNGPMRPVVYCHCSQCRKTSGHFVAASACDNSDLQIIDDDGLHWYASSQHAERGFCSVCGGNLFWRPTNGKYVSIMAGTIDMPTRLKAIAHIFVGDASDYHAIADELPLYQDGGSDELDGTKI